MPSLVNSLYEFGEFRLDVQRRILRRRQEPIALTPKAFELLLVMVQSDGRVVTKDELMKAVWSGSFVEESNLTQTVFMVRKALGETQEQRYILTVPGQGYRFAEDVKQTVRHRDVGVDLSTAIVGAELQARRSVGPSTRRRLPILIGIAVAGVAVLGAYLLLRPPSQPQLSGRRLMLAVLPFENLTGDAGQDYFSDGLTEEMITQLGRLNPEHLGVIARTSVMHYKHSTVALGQIGRELGVQYVLEGSVRRDSNKVRITAQLIRVKDQSNLWSRQYDRDLKDLLVLQSEITREISDEIEVALGDRRAVPPANPPSPSTEANEAHDLYLKGLYFWNKRSADGFRQAINYFQQATAKDPDYARAYAGLADSYTLSSAYGFAPSTEFMPKARAAALRALELDESLPEAHAALALIVQNYDWDWQTAEKEFRRALELNPNYATGHQWYAEHLALLGRFDEAVPEIDRAQQLDPLSLIISTDRGAIFYFSRQYDRAIQQFRTVLEMEPTFGRAHVVVYAYVQKGQFADALADIEKWPDLKDPNRSLMLAYVYGRSGDSVHARRALQKLEQLNRRAPLDPTDILFAYIGTGNQEQAFVWLEKAYAQHSILLTTLKADPVYDPLRGDPRFQGLLRRVGLTKSPLRGQ